MNFRLLFCMISVLAALTLTGCQNDSGNANVGPQQSQVEPVVIKDPHPLPDKGFNAQITLVEPPAKLRVGQKETIRVKIKNASDVLWYARGAAVNNAPSNRFYLAVADRWLEADGEKLVTDMDGRYGLPRDLKPGEETEVTLLITAPKDPGDYILDVDLVQEQVAWFHDKGSPTARARVSVVR